MKIQKVLRDERINIFGMTYGFPQENQTPHQIFLCKKSLQRKGHSFFILRNRFPNT